MELFMITTGFYKVATRKEAERLAMAKWEAEEAERRQQLKHVGVLRGVSG